MKKTLIIEVIVIGLLVLLVSCGDIDPKGEVKVEIEPILNQPDQIMTNSEIYITNGGKRQGVIKSETLKVYSKLDTTLMYNVEALFFDSVGDQISTVLSDSGIITQQNKHIELIGHVDVQTVSGKRLLTDSLRWNSKTEMIATEGYVEAFRGEDKLSGWGMESDQRLENIRIKRNIKGAFDDPGSEDN